MKIQNLKDSFIDENELRDITQDIAKYIYLGDWRIQLGSPIYSAETFEPLRRVYATRFNQIVDLEVFINPEIVQNLTLKSDFRVEKHEETYHKKIAEAFERFMKEVMGVG